MAAVRHVLAFAAAVCLLLVASSCGGRDASGGSAAANSIEPTTTEAGWSEYRCKEVPPALVDGIATGLTVNGGGTLHNAQAVKSNDFKRMWFISAEIDGPGMEGEGEIGTWAKGGPLTVGGGLILSVDSIAQEFSDWSHGDATEPNLSTDDDGAQESHDCVEGG